MNSPLFAYYGDDFTGSTDVLEALAGNGISTVLFLGVPDEKHQRAFRDCRAIGIAGESRSRDPQWMSENLPDVFSFLQKLGAPINLYKVCSTFDSSPRTGSIGKALEIGQDIFQSSLVPIVVAAPHLRRYVVFANLFAEGGGGIYRIDRHPTMMRHPVTPMTEGDLRRHLAKQTDRRVGLLDIVALHGDNARGALRELSEQGYDAVIIDGLDEESLERTGSLLWPGDAMRQEFVVGSSGAAYALIAHWKKAGLLTPGVSAQPIREVDRLLVLSGSCSPVTESQIRTGISCGFAGIALDAGALSAHDSGARNAHFNQAKQALAAGRSAILYSALGESNRGVAAQSDELAIEMGMLLRELIIECGVRRVVIAGGDTSSKAAQQLGLHALTFVASTQPGAPLCRGHADDAALDGLEIVLKGGQVGAPDFFEFVRTGRTS
ncbi:MAG: four-carbon acid sugar kinase family protein [Candidatus Acidiferrales bacterium]